MTLKLTDLLHPTGRPPMTCESINDDIFSRKYKESIQNSRKQKCESRKFHPHYPCDSIYDDSGKYLHCKSRLLKYDNNSFLVKNIQPRIVYLRPYSEQLYEIPEHKEHRDDADKENLLHAVQRFFKDRYEKNIDIKAINPYDVCGEVSQLKNDNNQKERFDYDSELLFDSLERVCRFSRDIQNTEDLMSVNTEKKMYFNATMQKEGLLNLCHALCKEMRTYAKILSNAVNLNPHEVNQTLNALRDKCQEQVDQNFENCE